MPIPSASGDNTWLLEKATWERVRICPIIVVLNPMAEATRARTATGTPEVETSQSTSEIYTTVC